LPFGYRFERFLALEPPSTPPINDPIIMAISILAIPPVSWGMAVPSRTIAARGFASNHGLGSCVREKRASPS
jgi:hypothetical protein